MDVTGIRTRPALGGVHGIALRIGVLIDPDGRALEADRIDHQRVALPPADLVAKKRGIGILRMFATIERNGPKVGVHVQKDHAVGVLHDLERQGAGTVSGYSTDDAQRLRINCLRQVVLQSRLAGGRQGQLEFRHVLANVAHRNRRARTLPKPAQVRVPIRRPRCRPRRRRWLLPEQKTDFLRQKVRIPPFGNRPIARCRLDPAGSPNRVRCQPTHTSDRHHHPAKPAHLPVAPVSPGPPSPALPPYTTRPSGNVTRRASMNFEPSLARYPSTMSRFPYWISPFFQPRRDKAPGLPDSQAQLVTLPLESFTSR